MPHSRATSITRSMARPTTTTSRPQASAASATARMRETFEAKVVTATLPFAALISSARVFATSVSLGLTPSRMTLVESQTMASTPLAPSSRKRASSVDQPTFGVSSIFQSPVWTTVPSGVSMASPQLSGMECATFRNSTLNGPNSYSTPGTATLSVIFGAPGSCSLRVSSSPAAKRVHHTGARSFGHSLASAPIWSSCACVMMMARRFFFSSSMKRRSGMTRSMPGASGPAKATPQSTRIHLRLPSGPKP